MSRKSRYNKVIRQMWPFSVVMPDPDVVTLIQMNHGNAVSFLTVSSSMGSAQHVSILHYLQIYHVTWICPTSKYKLIVPGDRRLEETKMMIISVTNVRVCRLERYDLMRTHLLVGPLQYRVEGYWICKTRNRIETKNILKSFIYFLYLKTEFSLL